ncbi:sugar kinase, partial [mine drainage metagenome]
MRPKGYLAGPSAASRSMTIVRAKAPLRISFAGGGTDVSPYPEERGGAVLNCTISRYVYATLEATPPEDGSVSVTSLDYNLSVNYAKP